MILPDIPHKVSGWKYLGVSPMKYFYVFSELILKEIP
jgi:hypothetical protein